MVEIRHLNAHDPVPSGRNVVVMRRFAEDEPDRLVVEIVLTHRQGLAETARPGLDLDGAIAAAKLVAAEEGVSVVQVIDRTAGPREQAVMAHHGDHGAGGGALVDDDLEEGERGPDLRDR